MMVPYIFKEVLHIVGIMFGAWTDPGSKLDAYDKKIVDNGVCAIHDLLR